MSIQHKSVKNKSTRGGQNCFQNVSKGRQVDRLCFKYYRIIGVKMEQELHITDERNYSHSHCNVYDRILSLDVKS